MMLNVSNFGFSYGAEQVLKNVSFSAEAGDLLLVLGPNGAGKSTLFKCLLGLENGYEGKIEINEKDRKEMSSRQSALAAAYVPQSCEAGFDYGVFDMVLMGTTARTGVFGVPGTEERKKALKSMEQIGISRLKNRSFMRISGGERQMVLIARALAQDAKLLIMDEPVSNLDYGNRMRVLECVKKLTRDGYTVLLSAHDPNLAFGYADKVLALGEGTVQAFGAPDEVVVPDLIRRLYGVRARIVSVDGEKCCLPRLKEREADA